MPGLRRPPIASHTASRLVRLEAPRGITSETMLIGTHASVPRMVVPWNPSGATPTTVHG